MVAFTILAVILVVTAFGVIISHNPINSALCLIANMTAVAGLFALLDAHFLAAVQIIVYAGAVMVLVLFVLMLLNIKSETPRKHSGFFIALCALSGALFVVFGIPALQSAFKFTPDSYPLFSGTMETIGKELYTKYIFPFEAASILLMAAIAGAVMLAKRKFR